MSQCYDWHTDTNTARVLSNVWVQCPSGLGCCIGGNDCLDYNLCKASSDADDNTNDSYSGYYVQRCTDPTYTDPACAKVCSKIVLTPSQLIVTVLILLFPQVLLAPPMPFTILLQSFGPAVVTTLMATSAATPRQVRSFKLQPSRN